MIKRSHFVVVALTLLVVACGGSGREPQVDPGQPVLQIVSEGGFVPVEVALGSGPRYTLLGDGRLIFSGSPFIETAELVQYDLVATMNDSQMNAVLAMVEDIGLPDIEDEVDDSATQFVADASTEVITYWDEAGAHRLSVYALGIEESPSDRNASFLELIETFDRFTAEANSVVYQPEHLRVIAGPGFAETQETRPWPLDDEWASWDTLANGWACRVFDPEDLDMLDDAPGTALWEVPDDFDLVSPVTLLVRGLHPGEPDCP